ncbi:MAG: type IV pilus assembly protein PilM [Planctomycetota bacterium]
MLKRRKSVVGLDVGSHEVKAVELTDFGDAIKITGFGCARIVAGEDLSRTVARLLHDAGINTKRVVSAVSGRSVIVRYITLPLMSEEELKGALRYEADKYIPFEIDEVTIDGVKLEEFDPATEGEKEMRVLLVAVKKDLLQEHIHLVQEIGLTPMVVDIDSFALGNAYEFRNLNSPRVDDEDKVVALVDVGASKTNINILRGKTSCFSREVYLGGNELTDSVARQLHVEPLEAEQLKRAPGEREVEVREALSPALDDLANEIHLSFDYFENQFDREVGEVYISGGCVETPGLKESFEKVFDRPIQTWDPTENIELNGDKIDVEELKAHAGQLHIAVGLGVRHLTT